MITVCLYFSMVTTRGGGFDSGSGSGAEPIDERMQEFITSEVIHGIMEATSVIFGTIKEGIIGSWMNVSGHFGLRLQ